MPVINCNCRACTSDDIKDKRLRCSVYIEWCGKNIVIDTGPDFRQQMLAQSVMNIDLILYTHEHYDHTAGIDDIRPYYFKNLKPIQVYFNQRVHDELYRRFNYIFAPTNYKAAPKVVPNVIEEGSKLYISENEFIEAIGIEHGDLSILGYRFDKFAYLTDVGAISQENKARLQNLEVLVISALQSNPHHSHLSLAEAVQMVEELKPGKAYFIHMSHNLGPVKEWSNDLPANIAPAYDGLSITI